MNVKKMLMRAAVIVGLGIMLGGAGTDPVMAGSFKLSMKKFYDRAEIYTSDEVKYPHWQGMAADTYTGRDFYYVCTNYGTSKVKDGSRVFVVHSSLKNGKLKRDKKVMYSSKNLGHANDATVYRKKSKKYLFIATGGEGGKGGKATSGKKAPIACINLADWAKGNKKVTAVEFKDPITSDAPSGITYVGQEKVSGKKRDIFVVKSWNSLYKCYLVGSEGKYKLKIIGDKGRFDMAKLPHNTYVQVQGVTYHRGYLYLGCAGKNKTSCDCYLIITRISYKNIFRGKTSSSHFMINMAKYGGQRYDRIEAESIGFTSTTKKSCLYVNLNRVTDEGHDADAMFISKQKM